jgi:hypothetical protein
LNESGLVNTEVVGKRRRIQIKENPPTCEINVKPAQLPEKYRSEKVKTTIVANKKAITAAWKKGLTVFCSDAIMVRYGDIQINPLMMIINYA